MTPNEWFLAADRWHAELRELRRIVLSCGLQETFKWRQPCYTAADRNIVILGSMKGHCVLTFFKGALVDDPSGLLEEGGPNSRAVRVLRCTSVDTILAVEPAIRALIASAVQVEQSGRKVEGPRAAPELVAELRERLAADDAFRAAFDALTPGRRRAYALHFGQAKRAASRVARIDRCTPRILAGKGLDDCVCGLTRRPPGCDGSHRGAGDSD